MSNNASPRVTLDQNEAQLFRRMAAQQAQQEERNKQNIYNAAQLRWLFNTPDYKDYNSFKTQTDHFKSGYWLAVLTAAGFIYLDTMSYLVQPVDRYNYYNQKQNDTPIIGTMMRSSGNIFINLALTIAAALYLLPWTLYAVWSPADEDPQEASFFSIALTHVRAYFLLQVAAPYFQVKLDVPPFLSNLKTELGPNNNNIMEQTSKQIQQQGVLGMILNSPAIMKTICAIGIPLLVGYLMFYRPFAKFWKKKTLVRHPLVLYAPQFGFVLLFCWWFVGTCATTKSVDTTLSFLYNEVFTRDFLFSGFNGNLNDGQRHKNRNLVLDFCSRVYGVIVPYCVVLLSVVSINHVLPSLESLSDFTETFLNHWVLKLLLHAVAALLLSMNGLLTPDVVVALMIGLIAAAIQEQRNSRRRQVNEEE